LNPVWIIHFCPNVLKGLAIDWWALLKNEWVDTGEFRIG
jgi:hypothetical protein